MSLKKERKTYDGEAKKKVNYKQEKVINKNIMNTLQVVDSSYFSMMFH